MEENCLSFVEGSMCEEASSHSPTVFMFRCAEVSQARSLASLASLRGFWVSLRGVRH